MKFVKLGEICEIRTGSTDTKDAVEEGQYPLFDRSKKIKMSDKFLFDCEALIMPGEGAEFLPRHYHGKFDLHQRAYAMFNFSDLVYPLYLYYYLISEKDYFANNAVGATVKSLRRRHFTDLIVPIPSIDKQREIVKILDRAFVELDALERNLVLNEEKTNQLLQSLLNEQFVSSDALSIRRKSDSNQGAVRKTVPIGEVCTLINGGTPDTKVSEYWGGNNAWITPAEMGGLASPYLSSSRRTLTDEGLRNSSAQLLPKHSVIMSSRAPIGHLVINDVPMASNQGCKGFIPNKELNYKYLYYFLFANKEYLNSLGSGTTFAEVSGAKLKTVLIPLPSLEIQLEIVRKLDLASSEIDFLRSNIKTHRELAVELRKSLLQTFISGQAGAA